MKTDQNSAGADNAAERGKSLPAVKPPSETREALRGIRSAFVVLWWRFFDWLAVVSWKQLLLVSLLGLILAAMLKYHQAFVLFIIVSIIIKVVAGGKRRAELNATEATKRAEREQLE